MTEHQRVGRRFSRKLYLISGFKTVQTGSGRPEFKPRDAHYMEHGRAHLEQLIVEAGRGALGIFGDQYIDTVASLIDGGSIGNYGMELLCNGQGHRPGFSASVHPGLQHITTIGTEGACASGGLALVVGIDKVLAGQSDLFLAIGAEEQNTMKALYVADALSGAGHVRRERGPGYGFFFPAAMGKRFEHYLAQFQDAKLRDAMTEWVVIAYENGNFDPKSQIFGHFAQMGEAEIRRQANDVNPGGKFVPNLSYLDCSKVTDAGAAVILASEEGLDLLAKQGVVIDKSNIVEIIGYGQSGRDITSPIKEPYKLGTTADAIRKAYESASHAVGRTITAADIGLLEVHDCFSNIGVMMLEATGVVEFGKGWQYVLDGHIRRNGKLPTNPFGGLISGHPVGETGIRQPVDILAQLTKRAGANQIILNSDKYAMSINMGGDDGTVVTVIYKRAV